MPGFQRYVSVQIGSSSIFSVPVRSEQRQRRYGTVVRTRLRKWFPETDTETDTDKQKRNAGNQTLIGRPCSRLTAMPRFMNVVLL